MIRDESIRNAAEHYETYTKGLSYYRNGYVKKLAYDKETHRVTATVQGSSQYNVTVQLSEDDDLKSSYCSCPAFRKYDGVCKHVVAVLKAVQSRWKELVPERIRLTAGTQAFLDFYGHPVHEYHDQELAKGTIRLVPTLHFSSIGAKQCWLEFTIGKERLYVMRSVKNFVECAVSGTTLTYGKNFIFDPKEARFDDMSGKLLSMLRSAYLDDRMLAGSAYYSSYHSGFQQDKRLLLTGTNIVRFLELMDSTPFDVAINGDLKKGLSLVNGRPPLTLEIEKREGGIAISPTQDEEAFYGLDHEFRYIYHDDQIYRVDETFSQYVAPILRCFTENRRPEITIPDVKEQEFFGNVLPALKKIATVLLAPEVQRHYYHEQLVKQVYFDRQGDGISARVVFQYGTLEINPLVKAPQVEDKERRLLRNLREENQLLRIFENYAFRKTGELYYLDDEDAMLVFLQDGLERLKDYAEVYYTDVFRQISIRTSGIITAGVRVSEDMGLLSLTFQYDQLEAEELLGLLKSYKTKRRYFRLKSGSFVDLSAPELLAVTELIDQLDITDPTKEVIYLPKYRAMYIDSFLRENKALPIERGGSFKRLVQDISEPQDMEFPLPTGLVGKLRDYQKVGFRWLKTLAFYGFGGILADDMGLGKTVQVLTLLLSEKRAGPSLVVAPTSLIYNWQEEAQKFAPELKVLVVSGSQEERQSKLDLLGQADLVVTSYGLLRNDIDVYKAQKFRFCFIDEAQQIKNPHTQNAKSVKQIQADSRFALTGTPIENTLTELWSIFDFVMPGYLLNHSKFTTRFETPIVKHKSSPALRELGRHIQPFLMRRLKRDVLQELPDKIECKMNCEMAGEQNKIYKATLLSAQKEFEKEIKANGFDRSRVKILAILTRLRQLCCHPALFLEGYKGGSAKLELLLELLADAVEGGHKVLVFSQFTSMLGLIRVKLEELKMRYSYLDGGTSAEERLRLVSSFNAGEGDVFLISLKAGGTGLNLTGADMVVHVDPWWNPAVEDQATDRAYRIGQTKAVEVFRLITKDTIEEKIFELQQKKRSLIDNVIQPGETFLTKMTEEEVRGLFSLT